MKRSHWALSLTALTGIALAGLVSLAGCGGDSDNDSGGLPGSNVGSRSQIQRGRYLVTAIGACQDCHGGGSPNDPNWLAGFKPGGPGAGNGQSFPIGAFTTYASNLTPDATGLGDWTPQEIYNALKTGKDDEGRTLCPPMPWPVFRNMTDDDIWSIVAYLRNIKAVQNEVPESQGPGPNGDWSSAYTNLQPLPAYPGTNENGTP